MTSDPQSPQDHPPTRPVQPSAPAAAPLNQALIPPIHLPQNIAPPDGEETQMGMLIHLLAIFTGWIAPLIFWLVKKDTSPFIDHHGKEALNFQITLFLLSMGLMAVSVVVALITMGIGMLILMPLFIAISILALVWEIQACTAASRGEWHRYPVCFRFIP